MLPAAAGLTGRHRCSCSGDQALQNRGGQNQGCTARGKVSLLNTQPPRLRGESLALVRRAQQRGKRGSVADADQRAAIRTPP